MPKSAPEANGGVIGGKKKTVSLLIVCALLGRRTKESTSRVCQFKEVKEVVISIGEDGGMQEIKEWSPSAQGKKKKEEFSSERGTPDQSRRRPGKEYMFFNLIEMKDTAEGGKGVQYRD